MTETIEKQKGLLRRSLTMGELICDKREFADRKDPVDVLTFPASSEEPVDRWFGTEILSHEKGAVRLKRADGGSMPLLFNHDIGDPIGMIVGARLEKNRLMVDARMFETPRAQEVRSMVDGGLRNVSIGYRIHTIEENKDSEEWTVRDWEPHEVSIVTVPADPTVGIGRSESTEYDVRMIRNTPAVTTVTTKERTMDDKKEQETEKRVTAVEAEKERAQAVKAFGMTNNIDMRVVDRWISEGTPLTKVADEILAVHEERGKQKPLEAARLGLTTKESSRFSIFRAVRAMHLGGKNRKYIEDAAFEIECSQAVAKKIGRGDTANFLIPSEVLERPLPKEALDRAMATTPGAKGGVLVNVTNMGFIDILRNRSVAMAMGSRVISGLVGNVSFPRQTGKPSVTWQAGDGASVTAADQTLGQLSMSPKTCIAITDVSEQLLAQSSPSAEGFIMADLAQDVAIDGVDAAVINGTGGAQPLGIKNTTGITSGQDAGTATYAKILAFPVVAGGVNAIRGNPGWVTNIAGAAVLMQKARFSNTDTPLWQGNLLDGTLVGFRSMASEQLASSNLIFGSWDEVLIGEWGVLELSTDNGGTRFNQAQVGIRAMWMVDVLVRYPQAFVVSTNLSA